MNRRQAIKLVGGTAGALSVGGLAFGNDLLKEPAVKVGWEPTQEILSALEDYVGKNFFYPYNSHAHVSLANYIRIGKINFTNDGPFHIEGERMGGENTFSGRHILYDSLIIKWKDGAIDNEVFTIVTSNPSLVFSHYREGGEDRSWAYDWTGKNWKFSEFKSFNRHIHAPRVERSYRAFIKNCL